MLRRIFNSIINGLRWYARHYLAVFCTSVFLLIAEVLSTYLPLVFHWRSNATDWLVVLFFLLTLLHCLLGLLLGIALMVKKRILRGIAYALTPIFFWFLSMFLCVVVGLFALSLSEPDDSFIKNHNITLPTDIELLEPEKATPIWKAQKDDSENEIEKEIKNAIVNGATLADDYECHIPAIERLMETDEGRHRLIHYLEASPDWIVFYNDIDGLNASWAKTETSFWGSLQENEQTWSHFCFGVRIFFGTPERHFAKNHKPYECTVKKEGNEYAAHTWIQAGSASLYIYEGITAKGGLHQTADRTSAAVPSITPATFDGRRVTNKLVELLESEFADIDIEKYGKEGTGIQVQLLDGFQGGIYVMKVWSNQGQPGTFSIKATEITKGIPLSEQRLKEHDVKTYGDSSSKLYYSQLDFTIYEGNWEEYYG
ncbi:MAG: hypothetical protein J5746_09120, partial [Victivallales bacterium]|nr:hypothetical protein [Victivallales bacterium]